jgi:hypothetical protein
MRRRLANLRWRWWTWVSGHALVKLAHAALDRDDLHEAAHIAGMVQLGDTSFCTPGDCVQVGRLHFIGRQWEQMDRERRSAVSGGENA